MAKRMKPTLRSVAGSKPLFVLFSGVLATFIICQLCLIYIHGRPAPTCVASWDRSSRIPGVALVTGIRNRAPRLEETLPNWLSIPFAELIIVDWGSDDDIAGVVARAKDPRIKLVSVPRAFAKTWILSQAINLALKSSSADWLLKVDADTVLKAGVLDVHPQDEGVFYAGNWQKAKTENQRHLNGVVYCSRRNFARVNGYDDRVRTYGWDDDGLYERLLALPLRRLDISLAHIDHMPHSDKARLQAQAFKGRRAYPYLEIVLNKRLSRRAPAWDPSQKDTTFHCTYNQGGGNGGSSSGSGGSSSSAHAVRRRASPAARSSGGCECEVTYTPPSLAQAVPAAVAKAVTVAALRELVVNCSQFSKADQRKLGLATYDNIAWYYTQLQLNYPGAPKALVLRPTGGCGFRVRAIAAAKVLASRWGLPLHVIWLPSAPGYKGADDLDLTEEASTAQYYGACLHSFSELFRQRSSAARGFTLAEESFQGEIHHLYHPLRFPTQRATITPFSPPGWGDKHLYVATSAEFGGVRLGSAQLQATVDALKPTAVFAGVAQCPPIVVQLAGSCWHRRASAAFWLVAASAHGFLGCRDLYWQWEVDGQCATAIPAPIAARAVGVFSSAVARDAKFPGLPASTFTGSEVFALGAQQQPLLVRMPRWVEEVSFVAPVDLARGFTSYLPHFDGDAWAAESARLIGDRYMWRGLFLRAPAGSGSGSDSSACGSLTEQIVGVKNALLQAFESLNGDYMVSAPSQQACELLQRSFPGAHVYIVCSVRAGPKALDAMQADVLHRGLELFIGGARPGAAADKLTVPMPLALYLSEEFVYTSVHHAVCATQPSAKLVASAARVYTRVGVPVMGQYCADTRCCGQYLHVISQFFLSSASAKRRARSAEYIDTARRNLQHPQVAGLHLLLESEEQAAEAYRLLSPHDKCGGLKITVVGHQPLYSELFGYANSRLFGHVVAVTNGDIYMGDGFDQIDPSLLGKKVLAPTRWENPDCNRSTAHSFCPLYRHMSGAPLSHDTFIFMAPISSRVLGGTDFVQNRGGAENVVIHMMKKSGHPVFNPCRNVKVHHNHCTGLRTWSKEGAAAQEKHSDPSQRMDLKRCGDWICLDGWCRDGPVNVQDVLYSTPE